MGRKIMAITRNGFFNVALCLHLAFHSIKCVHPSVFGLTTLTYIHLRYILLELILMYSSKYMIKYFTKKSIWFNNP